MRRESFLVGIGASALAALGFAPTARAVVGPPGGFPYFVALTGSDGNDGKSWETAFRTISRAMQVARVGSNVFVGPGTFVETVQMARCNLIGYGPDSGNEGTTIQAPADNADCLVISGYKVEANVLGIQTNGSGPNWTGRGIYLNQSGYLTIDRWTHRNNGIVATSEGCGTGVRLDGNTEHVSFRRCSINNAGRGIHGYSCSVIEFTGVTLSTGWKDVHLENLAGTMTFRAVKSSVLAPRQNEEDCVYVGTGGHVFDACDFGEAGSQNTVRIANANEDDNPGSVFLGCNMSPNTRAIVAGNRNRFISGRFARLSISGSHNKFDGCLSNKTCDVTGNFNEFDDWRGSPVLATVTGSRNVWRRPSAKYYGKIVIGGTYNLIDEPDFPKPTTYQLAPTNEVRKMGA